MEPFGDSVPGDVALDELGFAVDKVCLRPGAATRSIELRIPIMAAKFMVGGHLPWNSEAGHVCGKMIKVHTKDADYKRHTHHASLNDPRYETESDKTDHSAMHKGEALKSTDVCERRPPLSRRGRYENLFVARCAPQSFQDRSRESVHARTARNGRNAPSAGCDRTPDAAARSPCREHRLAIKGEYPCVLPGTASAESNPLRPLEFCQKHRIDLKLDASVILLDTTSRHLQLVDGSRVAYDVLLLAIAAEPVRLIVPGGTLRMCTARNTVVNPGDERCLQRLEPCGSKDPCTVLRSTGLLQFSRSASVSP
ncbi:HVA1 family protein [Caballeronia sp. SBC1]|uniref:DUF2945 domain-containing protein n=2 Tax=unclassified Caballeronia TaxID=2646786 RepID=UPI0035301657